MRTSDDALERCDVACICGWSELTYRQAGRRVWLLIACLASLVVTDSMSSCAQQNGEGTEFTDLAIPPLPVKEFLSGAPDSHQGQPCCHPHCACMDGAACLSPSMEIMFLGGR